MSRFKHIASKIKEKVVGRRIELPSNPNIHSSARLISSSVDNNAKIGPYSLVRNSSLSGHVQVGDHSAVVESSLSGNVQIGRYTTFNGPGSDVTAKIHGVSIGNFCSIARNCTIQEFNHITDRCTTYYIFRNLLDAQDRQEFIWGGDESKDIDSHGPIEIGHDVWIGAQVVILSGVTVGHGAVIAANSTVTKDVPPYAVVGGTPGKVLKYRFSEEIIKQLLDVAWWSWDDEKIRLNRDFFDGPMTQGKIDHIKPAKQSHGEHSAS
jgi:acetyltransferase-like isoleucine patch superfamily enzyme